MTISCVTISQKKITGYRSRPMQAGNDDDQFGPRYAKDRSLVTASGPVI